MIQKIKSVGLHTSTTFSSYCKYSYISHIYDNSHFHLAPAHLSFILITGRCLVLHGELLRPLLGRLKRQLLVVLPRLGYLLREGIVWVGRGQQRLDGQEHGSNLKRGAPLILEDVKADAAKSVYVGVIDLRQEANLC